MAVKDNFNKQIEDIGRQLKIISIITSIASILFIVLLLNPNGFSFETIDTEQTITEVNEDLIENGIHVRTGFKDAEGLLTVVQNCTSCHSSKLVIQNRMNADRWNATIK
tara:strand:+ start:299 stop:625 length:327 start_codon:yes stop_codon:yes gene_type:complete